MEQINVNNENRIEGLKNELVGLENEALDGLPPKIKRIFQSITQGVFNPQSNQE